MLTDAHFIRRCRPGLADADRAGYRHLLDCLDRSGPTLIEALSAAAGLSVLRVGQLLAWGVEDSLVIEGNTLYMAIQP